MIACVKCMAQLDEATFNTSGLSACPTCGTLTRSDVFPALYKEIPTGNPGETLLVDEEASCFYHPQKKAVTPCSECGRFLCALCDVELNGEHLCLSCLQADKKHKDLDNQRILYDNIALCLAVGAFLMWIVSCITAPIVIYIVIRYWKAPTSILPRTKIRFIAAFIIASLQIAGWLFLILS